MYQSFSTYNKLVGLTLLRLVFLAADWPGLPSQHNITDYYQEWLQLDLPISKKYHVLPQPPFNLKCTQAVLKRIAADGFKTQGQAWPCHCSCDVCYSLHHEKESEGTT
jgi:hypothetical protein